MSIFSSFSTFFREKVLSGQAGMWVAIGVLIGVAAGVGSLILYNLIRFISYYLLTGLTGFTPPLPGAEGGTAAYSIGSFNRFLIPLSTTLGGFISGYMVYRQSPGSEGLGVNAAINAFHNLTVRVKNRTPAVKLAASAVVIGSGGSAGRDGPVALISAVFGSFLADIFKLDDHDRRIAMAAGIGAGFGSIFMAPIGGAIMSTEILYRKDFEVEALIPAAVASVVGFAIFGFQFHYTFLFPTMASSFLFSNADAIILYAVLGLIAGLAGKFYVRTFDLINLFFLRLRRVPIYIKPAIGGLIVGIIAIFFPEVLGLGYGWVQLIVSGILGIYTSVYLLPVYAFFVLFLLKILATSFSVGSGGSGGVFAPSIVSGAFLGAGLGIVLHPLFPSVTIAEMTVVTMMAFFAGVSKTPVSMLIMGTEMAGGLDMFLPLMIAVAISFFVCGTRNSIYNAQVTNRIHSPEHMSDFSESIMKGIGVSDSMEKDFLTDSSITDIGTLQFRMKARNRFGAVIVDDGTLKGYVTRGMIQESNLPPDRKVSMLITGAPVTMKDSGNVSDALALLPPDPEKSIIVTGGPNGEIRGTLGFKEIADAYENAFRKSKIEQMKSK